MARRGALNWAIAEEIKQRRKDAGMTQPEVVAATGIPRTTYENCEYAKRTISCEQIAAIGAALGTTGGTILDAAEARVKRGEVPSFSERAATSLDAAIGYRRPK